MSHALLLPTVTLLPTTIEPVELITLVEVLMPVKGVDCDVVVLVEKSHVPTIDVMIISRTTMKTMYGLFNDRRCLRGLYEFTQVLVAYWMMKNVLKNKH